MDIQMACHSRPAACSLGSMLTFPLSECVRWIILVSLHFLSTAQLLLSIFSRSCASLQLWWYLPRLFYTLSVPLLCGLNFILWHTYRVMLVWQRRSHSQRVLHMMFFKTWKGWWAWTTENFCLRRQWKLSLMWDPAGIVGWKRVSRIWLLYLWSTTGHPPKKGIPRKSLCLLPSRLVKSSPLRSLWLPQRLLIWSSPEPVQPLKANMKRCKHLFSSLSVAAVLCPSWQSGP